jgi:hypothetical protein
LGLVLGLDVGVRVRVRVILREWVVLGLDLLERKYGADVLDFTELIFLFSC